MTSEVCPGGRVGFRGDLKGKLRTDNNDVSEKPTLESFAPKGLGSRDSFCFREAMKLG